jgi:hypothetical protein
MQMVRRAVPLAFVVFAMAAAAEEPAAPPPPPTQETKVLGTLPADLEGRWLLMSWLDLPQDRTQTTAAIFEVARDGDRLVVQKRYVTFPATQQAEIDASNHEGKTHWEPSADDLKQIAAGWESLPPFDPYLTSVTTELIGADAFDDTIKSDERSKGAKWLLRTVENFRAAPEIHSIRQVSAYPVTDSRGDGYVANFTALHLAAAPLPIPITIHGTARFYRLATTGTAGTAGAAPAPVTTSTVPAAVAPATPASPPVAQPPRGLLARLLDLFSGCGKR